jgi:WD40 repeat protein
MDETTVPTEYLKLVMDFPERLKLASKEKPLFLFLDALDQLSDLFNASNLSWLPELPEHVRIVVSTLPEPYPCLTVLKNRLPAEKLIELGMMQQEEGSVLLDLWLADAGRTLQDLQRDEILSKFTINGLPLYLRLAFEESRRWRSYIEYMPISSDIPGIIRDLFRRLANKANHGKVLVERSLGYLGASKNGLTEDEVLDVLSRDHSVMADFKFRSPKSPSVNSIPVVVWSRLYFDIKPYLNEKNADGTSLLAFFHRQFSEVVSADFLADFAKLERHKALADYFGMKPHMTEINGKQNLNFRKLSELPYHQRNCGMWNQLEKTLCDLSFIEAKCTAVMTYDLIADYDETLAAKNLPREHRSRIEEFLRFVRAQSHLLTKYPALTFQQAFNEPDSTAPAQAARQRVAQGQEIRPRLRWINKLQIPSFCLNTFVGHRDLVNSCDVSFDNTRIVSASSDKEIKVWDSNGKELLTLRGHSVSVETCSFSPDGKHIVSGSRNGEVKLWDSISGRELYPLTGHKDAVPTCVFSFDGKRIASTSYDGTLKIWDAESGALLNTLDHNNVLACSFSPDSSRIVSGAGDGSLKVWDIKERKEIASLKGHNARIDSCNFSPDGSRIVSTSWDHTLKIWDIENPSTPITLIGHTDQLQDACFSSDGKKILSVGMDGTFRLWDAQTGSQLGILVSPSNSVTSCSFSPDGMNIASVSHNRALKLWNGANGTEKYILHGHESEICACIFSPDNRQLLSASSDRTLKLWDAVMGKELMTLSGHLAPVQTCAFSPDGRRIVSGAWDNTVKIWDTKTGALLDTLTGHEGWVQKVLFSPDGKLIVSCSHDKTIRIWETASVKLLFLLAGHKDIVKVCAYSPDGSKLVSGSGDGDLKIWDVQTGQDIFTLTGHTGAICSCAFSPDGLYIASASMDKTIRIWNARNGKVLKILSGHENWVFACAFSPDGKKLVSGSQDHFLRIWDIETGKIICEYWAGASVQVVNWHPADKKLAAGDGSGRLHFLELDGNL